MYTNTETHKHLNVKHTSEDRFGVIVINWNQDKNCVNKVLQGYVDVTNSRTKIHTRTKTVS